MNPTKQLRAQKRFKYNINGHAIYIYVIQQLWVGKDGEREWRDLPVVDEDERGAEW